MPPGILLPARFRRMAPVDTSKRHKVCSRAGVLMAVCAGRIVVRDLPIRVIECCRGPVCGCVTGRARARRRETVAGVIRHGSAEGCSAVPIGGVATVAIRRRHGGTYVAKIAGHGSMRARESKTCRAVIEGCAEPTSRCVAGGASRRITKGDVVWHGSAQCRGALPVGGMAAIAIGRQRPGVIAVHVAQSARHCDVGAGQWESRCAVVKG